MGVSREGFIVVARLQTGPTVQVERSPDQTPKIREGEADTPPQRGGSAENKATASTDQRQNTNAASAIETVIPASASTATDTGAPAK